MQNITEALVAEHRLILRMLDLIARNAPLTSEGRYRNYRFYLDAVDFIRNYADRYHHAKEEDVLFEALVENGMPRHNSPVAAMLLEHDHGRALVRELETAAADALAGRNDRDAEIARLALEYRELLLEHIAKEDDILYPLAERLISGHLREKVTSGYARAEAGMPDDLTERYTGIVTGYEREAATPAAAA
ncbi:hemerythrin domain-containing protein [Geobacter sp. DSM 9736]|uniref:hemerythrin domain-containing protein n=1 Tax=Geobacter sp. DSM 9736 TaxID=1277350 RepID=UPI000B5095C2|nr:hemerythrin domain-containing protein [Geobacter sp. DSM 9736]SNB46812.1 Hemerythrin-like domain-containing protein [Geobacter sp. DSM 9736]